MKATTLAEHTCLKNSCPQSLPSTKSRGGVLTLVCTPVDTPKSGSKELWTTPLIACPLTLRVHAGFRPLPLRFWLASAEAERVPDGAKEGAEGWNQKLAACRHGVCVFPQHSHNICRRNPSANPIHRDETYSTIRRQDEYGWSGNASFFLGVVNVPLLHDATFPIGENRER